MSGGGVLQAEGAAQGEAWGSEGRAGRAQGPGLCSKCDGKSLEGSSAGHGEVSFLKLDTLLLLQAENQVCGMGGEGRGERVRGRPYRRLGQLSRPEVTGLEQE